MTIAATAVWRPRVCGMPTVASCRSVATSRMTMKRHRCSLALLPDHRAASTIASIASSLTGSSVNSRYCRVRTSGRTISRGVSPAAMPAAYRVPLVWAELEPGVTGRPTG